MSKKVPMDVGEDGVALMIINNPPVNALATSVLNELYRNFEEVRSRNDIKAVVIAGANKVFSGGADIRDFQRKQQSEDELEKPIASKLQVINVSVEGCPKPVVAAIDGFALGGGLELAMACHARIATLGAQLGLPELQLGIIPGLGGTQRLPRLAGMRLAVDMLLTSRTIDAEKAREAGLVDDIATDFSDLLIKAKIYALRLRSIARVHLISLHRTDKLVKKDEALNVIKDARLSIRRKFGNLSYPSLCLDAIEEGLLKGGEAGVLLENKISRSLVTSTEARALMHFFFAQRSSWKVPGISNLGLQARPIHKAAVIGGGWMGTGIATALVIAGIPVILKDLSLAYVERSTKHMKENLENLVEKGKMTKLQSKNALSLLTVTDDFADFKHVDLVIESVNEDVTLKQSIFAGLSDVCRKDCIVASNTSSIDIGSLGANIVQPERVVGLHFFSPAHIMQLLEIARTQYTSPQVMVDMLALAKTLRKTPLVVKSSIGFAANRLFVPYLMTAYFLIDLGLDPYRIDAVVKDFGLPMGPFRVMDFTGIKTFQLVSQLFHEKFLGRFHRSPLVQLLLNDNRLGTATRRGFYNYKESGEVMKTTELEGYLQESRRLAQLNVSKHALTHSDEEIVELVFFPVINEACRILEDGIVSQPAALDIASVLGMGFPSYKGGIIFWADNVGLTYIFDQLKRWWLLYGEIYKPCSLLEKLAASSIPLGNFSAKLSSL